MQRDNRLVRTLRKKSILYRWVNQGLNAGRPLVSLPDDHEWYIWSTIGYQANVSTVASLYRDQQERQEPTRTNMDREGATLAEMTSR